MRPGQDDKNNREELNRERPCVGEGQQDDLLQGVLLWWQRCPQLLVQEG